LECEEQKDSKPISKTKIKRVKLLKTKAKNKNVEVNEKINEE